jgi:membrane protease YdiL (CAAX protease family)
MSDDGVRRSLAVELGLVGSPQLGRDPQFWVALAAGPVAWAVLGLAGLLPSRVSDPVALAGLVLVRPVVEEFVFRGALQGWALDTNWGGRRLGPLTAANAASSVLFVAAHALAQTPGWAAAVLLPSLIFGYFRERTGSLVAPCLLHGFYNAGFFVLG